MLRVIRNLALAALIFLLLAIITVGVATLVLKPNDYKPHIEQLVKDHTRLDMHIEGDLDWSLIPLGLSIHKVDASLEGVPFLRMETLIAQMDFWSVLRMQPTVHTVILDGLDAQLERNAEGQGNWERIVPEKTDAEKAATTEAPSTPTAPAQPLQLKVEEIRITNSRASFKDAQSGQNIALENLNLATRGIGLEGGIQIASIEIKDTGLSLQDKKAGRDITLKGLTLSLTDIALGDKPSIGQLHLKDLQLSLKDQQGQTITLNRLQASVDGLSKGQSAPVTLDFDLALAQPQLQVRGDIKAQIKASDSLRQFDVNGLDSHFTLQGAPFNGKTVDTGLAGNVRVGLDKELTNLSGLVVKLANLTLNTTLEAKGFSEPALSGELKIDTFSPRQLLAALGAASIPTRDDQVLDKLSLSTRLNGPAGKIELTDLQLILDDTTFKGGLGYTLKSGAIAASLQADNLDLDRYLPPESTATATAKTGNTDTAQTASTAAAAEADLLPLKTLRDLALDIQFGLNQLTVNKINISSLRTKITARDGQIEIKPISGKLFDGSFEVLASLDARSNDPRWQIKQTLTGVQTLPLLKQLAEVEKLSGGINLKADVSTHGNRLSSLRSNAQGQIDFQLADGALEGMNLTALACQGIALANQESIATDTWPQRTPFNAMNGSLLIKGNLLENTQLSAALAGLVLDGKGRVDLQSMQLDYAAGLRIVGEVSRDPACRVNERVQGLSIPVSCKGSLTGDTSGLCRFDSGRFGDTLKDLVEAELKRKAGKELDKALDKGLEKGLDKLFNRGKGAATPATTPDPLAAPVEGAQPTDAEAAPAEPASEKEQAREAAKDLLKGLLSR